MPVKLFWLQCGGCGGDTWSLFNAESPDLIEFVDSLDIEMLWHPSISSLKAKDQKEMIDRLGKDDLEIDILCIEGSILCGPSGTGMCDTIFGKPKKELISLLSNKAKFVIAVGTCAAFGGIGGDDFVEATGVQFRKAEKGGLLGKDFITKSGLPVINLPGCPCHCDIIKGTLSAIVEGTGLELREYNTPEKWYGMLVHEGCTRNEYHEYRVEEKKFGEKGCMFFYLGCHGPLAWGPCNKILWNRRSSKTRIGLPCFGCTRPDFPQQYPFFETRNIEGIPIELPEGVSRAHYLAYKSMAAAAAPERLKTRKTEI
ncbi:MAG: NADH:ubiquinone oxidoreductase [Proteobacteria bacterium]|nr:NADH:ubiquinone oxidoreductase [Pseudomonadota bacterium]